MNKKNVKLYALICAVITVVVSLSVTSAATVNGGAEKYSPIFKVAIDAGHGGIDGGVTGKVSGVTERDLNLVIAKKLRDKLELCGIETVLTRTNSLGLYGSVKKGFKLRDLKRRVEIVKDSEADVLISIHMNYYADGNCRGAQVFGMGNYSDQKATAETIAKGEKFALAVQGRINEMESRSRECEVLKGDYYMLNFTGIPSILVECGFLSNNQDEKQLLSVEFQDELCRAIADGILDYFA